MNPDNAMREKSPIRFCTRCGTRVIITIPEGDNRQRHVCTACGEIQYQNPKIVTGCIPVCGNRILLCKRAIDPRMGYWTIPAGFMENDETLEQGAIRETWEEAMAKVTDLQLYQIFDVPRINQVYILYRANLAEPGNFGAGPESLEVQLVPLDAIPWDEMAFLVIRKTLERYLEDWRIGSFTFSADSMNENGKPVHQS